MQKKNLFASALLCASMFLFTGCDKIMSHFDNSVDSHLEMNTSDVALFVGQKASYPATTLSDEKIVYGSSDSNIVTVDQEGNIEAVGAGTATISAFVKDNGLWAEGNVSYKVVVEDFDLKKQYDLAFEKAAGGDVTIVIPVDVKAVQSTKIKTTAGQKLTVKSENPKNPSTITLKVMKDDNDKDVPMFEINASIVLQDVKIDASELASPLIQIGTVPGSTKKNQDVYLTQAVIDAGKTKLDATAYIMDEITIENCEIKNLVNAIVWNGSTEWAIEQLNIKNNIIQLNNEKKDFFRVHAVKDLNIIGNTIYNLKKNKDGYVVRQSNASNAAKYYGLNIVANNASLNWTINDNTLIRTMTGKAFANNPTNQKALTITLKDNLLYDVYQLQKIFASSTTKVYDKATNFIYGEEVTIDGTDKGTYCTELTAAPFTAPTTALDLTKKYGGLNLKPSGDAANAGDPRWYKEIN